MKYMCWLFLFLPSVIFSCTNCAELIQDELIKADREICQFLRDGNGNESFDEYTYYYLQGLRSGLQKGKELVEPIKH